MYMFSRKKYSKKQQPPPARPADGPPVDQGDPVAQGAPANPAPARPDWGRITPTPNVDGPARDHLTAPKTRVVPQIPQIPRIDTGGDLGDIEGDVDFDTGFDDGIGPAIPPLTIPGRAFTSAEALSPRLLALDDETRYAMNHRRNMELYETLWAYYFDPGTGSPNPDARPDMLYGLMSGDMDNTTYLAKPVEITDILDFVRRAESTGNCLVLAQNGDDLAEGLQRADYIHVINMRHRFDPRSFNRRMRRLVFNVGSQKAALELARALTPLFEHPQIGPLLVKFKMIVGVLPLDEMVKNDKMVVYYLVGDDPGDRSDVIGDTLLTTVAKAMPEGLGGFAVSPFYSRVATFAAWAEEAEHHMPGKKETSFTDSRAEVVRSVIAQAESMPDAQTLATLVFQAMEEAGIPGDMPHRHY